MVRFSLLAVLWASLISVSDTDKASLYSETPVREEYNPYIVPDHESKEELVDDDPFEMRTSLFSSPRTAD